MGDWVDVASSNLVRCRYDDANTVLEIEFKGGRIYQYFDVPQNTFEGLVQAPSKGKFFNEMIKNSFRYARV